MGSFQHVPTVTDRKGSGDADSQKHILTDAHDVQQSSRITKETAITVTRYGQ